MNIRKCYQSILPVKGKSVLLVENDIDSAKRSIGMLTAIGLQVFHACTLRTALKFIEEHHFDIVLFDVAMPDGTGSELLNAINFTPKFANSSLFAMTNIVNPFLRQNYLAKGVHAYFEKPLCQYKLESRLQLIDRAKASPSQRVGQAPTYIPMKARTAQIEQQ